jgi:predicted permease
LRATRAQPASALSSGSRGTTAGRERFGLRRILVAAQIAMSLVLMVSALLFVRSLRNLMTLEPGFQENGILLANVSYPNKDVPENRLLFLRHEVVERVRAIPGVDDAADTATVPAIGNGWTNNMWMDGSDANHGREVFRSLVGSGYFRTIGTPLLAGREFDERDTRASQNVAIVSEEFVRTFSLRPNPVGEKFWIERTPFAPQMVVEIIGVAKNSKYRDLRQNFVPLAFFPTTQFEEPLREGSVLIRSRASLETLTPSIRRAITDVSPSIQYSFAVLKTRIETTLLRERLMAILSGLFGALAVLLASVGLYGVISYTVARRTNEIGIRIALGASRRSVIGLVLRETGMLLVLGLGAGIVISLAAGRAVASLLFGLQANDPLTFVAAGTVLAVVALGASYVPAYRASAVDPAIALRQE